jgi:hypothetical protein
VEENTFFHRPTCLTRDFGHITFGSFGSRANRKVLGSGVVNHNRGGALLGVKLKTSR